MQMKPIVPGDADALLALMRRYQEDDPWSIPFEEKNARKVVDLLLLNPTYGLGWFVEDESQRIGYIILSFDFSLEFGGRNAWVDEFFILKEHRGRGVGARVLEFFEHAAREAGATAIHLGVTEGNRAAELYRRRGFEGHHRYMMTKLLR